MNNYINKLNSILNFEIEDINKLSIEEQKIKISNFRKELTFEKYEKLFNDLNNYILDNNISSKDKNEVILLLIKVIRSYSILENNIEKFPNLISNIYQSYLELNKLIILFEQIYNLDFCVNNEYEKIVSSYLTFLDNPENELFIMYCSSEINNMNNLIIEYLSKEDFNHISFKNYINKELIETLNNRLEILTNKK